jgi:hypothetical protein
MTKLGHIAIVLFLYMIFVKIYFNVLMKMIHSADTYEKKIMIIYPFFIGALPLGLFMIYFIDFIVERVVT